MSQKTRRAEYMVADCVSIVTRTKDRPLLVWRSMESVLNQSHENWVHIIVNDGGKADILQGIVDKYLPRYRGRLKIIQNPESLGAGPALNVGMKAADSDYVITHDDDDSWEPEFLEKSIEALRTHKHIVPNARGIMSHTTAVYERISGQQVIERYRCSFNGWVKTVPLPQLCAGNFIPPISFLFERSVFSEIGFFNDAIHPVEDWEFYLRFLSKYEIAVLPAHLANYHLRSTSANIYGNTVTLGIDTHRVVAAALRNNLIRHDLASGKFGLGYLVALSGGNSLTEKIRRRFWHMRQRLFGRWKANPIDRQFHWK